MKGMDFSAQNLELRYGWALSENQVYESVNVLGGAIRAIFVQHCIMIAC